MLKPCIYARDGVDAHVQRGESGQGPAERVAGEVHRGGVLRQLPTKDGMDELAGMQIDLPEPTTRAQTNRAQKYKYFEVMLANM
jgi:hypothetical protein